MKITLIAEGSTKWQRFIKRWGVSFLIGEDILFDAFGDPRAFQKNLDKFKIDIGKINRIVLSHDHWDHVSGFWNIIPRLKSPTVYICSRSGQSFRNRVMAAGVNIVNITGMAKIRDNVYSSGELKGEIKGETIYEQSVVIETGSGLVLICGCAHPGVVDVVRQVKREFGKDVRFLIGGFHLKDNDSLTNEDIAKALLELGVRKIAPMHCTGKDAVKTISRVFGDGVVLLKEGASVEL
ncbi:MAG TPA: MBL fold metallo-hydrolase [Candidatus Omnitrophota bacterium]|nr:MBL fold metallo-hydrolase [Candidatus Omnitrophota bacterium]